MFGLNQVNLSFLASNKLSTYFRILCSPPETDGVFTRWFSWKRMVSNLSKPQKGHSLCSLGYSETHKYSNGLCWVFLRSSDLGWPDLITFYENNAASHTFCAHDSTGSWAHHQEKKACKHWYIFHNTFSKLTQSRLKWAGYHPSKWQAFCENSAHSKASRIIIIYIHLHKFPKENLCPANREPCSESFLPVLQIRQSHYSRDGWFKAKTLLISLLRAGGLLWDLINIS